MRANIRLGGKRLTKPYSYKHTLSLQDIYPSAKDEQAKNFKLAPIGGSLDTRHALMTLDHAHEFFMLPRLAVSKSAEDVKNQQQRIEGKTLIATKDLLFVSSS